MTEKRRRPQAAKPRGGKTIKQTRKPAEQRGERYNRRKDNG